MTEDNSIAVLTGKEAAKYVGISHSTLTKRRLDGEGPLFLKLGGKVAYRKADLDQWLQSRVHKSTSEYVKRNA